MKKGTKNIFLVIFSLIVVAAFVIAGCGGKVEDGGEEAGKMKGLFGASADGIEMTTDWKFTDTTFETENANEESVVFSKNMLNDYAVGYSVKITKTSDAGDALLGAYAYYADSDNYVKYTVNAADKTLTIKWSSGFDSYENTLAIGGGVNFNDYVSVKVERIAKEFKFFINGEIVQGKTYSFEDAGQVGFINNYVAASYKDFAFAEITEFSDASISMSAFTQITREGTGRGTWTLEGDTITNDCADIWETYVFDNTSINMVLDLDFTRIESAGSEPLGGLSVYLNSSNWFTMFFNDDSAEIYLCEKGYQGWTGPSIIINIGETNTKNVRVEKVGGRFAFYMNGVLFRAIDDATFINSAFAIETKHAKQSIKINEFKEIDDFTDEYEFSLMTKTNFNGEYVDGAYVFKESPRGQWGGNTVPEPGLEGGLHFALGNMLAVNYTFETVITLSKDENASGLAGIAAFYHFLGNGLYLLIDSKTGNIDMLGTAITGSWNGDIKNITEFGLEITDDIPVKVVKRAGRFTFYVNDIEAMEFTHAYYSGSGCFGYVATSPAADSETTGQIGATFSGTRFTTDNYTYGYGADNHRFHSWQIIEEATCEKDGLKKRVCMDCGEEESQVIPQLDHDLGAWQIETYPTYNETGLKQRVCSICHKVIETEIIPIKTAEVNLTEESKENYSYSANLKVSDSGENAYVGGYVFYADESNNISYRINPATDVLSVVSVVEGVETTYDVNLTALDYANGVDVLVEKVGTNYQIAVDDKLVYADTLTYAGPGKSGWISEYATVTATDVAFETLNAFTEKDILFGVHENAVHIGDGEGSWEIDGNAITSNCYASYEALFFNYANGVKPMVNVNDVSLTVVATYGENHPQGDGRTGFRIYLDGNHFIDAYYINKGNPGDIVYYAALGGNAGWLLQGEGGYYDDIPNYVDQEPVEMHLEKVGKTINFYANGVFLRGITADFIENSWISIINKHNSRTYTVTEYKTISELTAVTYGLLAGTNMAKSYSDGKYTFEQSASGLWAGALPGLEGGFTMALVNERACDYTFESKVKIATESTSSGTAGVVGFWNSGSNKSWLYFDKNGNMDMFYDLYGNYSGDTKNISDFGLTVDDEITVKVVKAGNRLDYYVNGTLAYTLETDYIITFGNPGFFGTMPVANSGTTGQYGATFEIVSLTLS